MECAALRRGGARTRVVAEAGIACIEAEEDHIAIHAGRRSLAAQRTDRIDRRGAPGGEQRREGSGTRERGDGAR